MEACRVARTRPHLSLQILESALRRGLLGLLLAPPGADADLIAMHGRPDLEAAVVRRPELACHLVAHHVSVPREPLLELRLEVEAPPGSVGGLPRGRPGYRPR